MERDRRADAVALATAVLARERSAGEVVGEALARAGTDPFGSFWTLVPERALAQAAAIDRELARGRPVGPLAGVPVGIKDVFDLAGAPSSYGVRWATPSRPARCDSEAVRRLVAAGAVPIGKTAMHQLAWDMSGEAPGFPVSRNPHDPGRMPGGSSGGSAAAVASGVLPLALGSDTGGSIRQPAAWCGVAGFKPGFGTVPLEGCAPLCEPLDTGGPLAASVRDCRVAFGVLAGSAPALPTGVRLRVGVLEALFQDVEGEIERRCREALEAWSVDGAELMPLALPWAGTGLGPIFAAQLALHWGDRVAAQPDGILSGVREGVERGRQVTAVDYLAALDALARARHECAAAVTGADVVACPTSPLLPPPIGDPDPTAVAGRNTRIFNGLLWPALSLPCGRADGLPVGLMLAALPGREADLLAAAESLELLLAP